MGEQNKNEVKNSEIKIENGTISFKLSKKMKFNDVEIEKVDLDLNSLTGGDICEAETNFRERFFQPIPDANYSQAYQAAVAAKASGLPYEFILELNPRDFSRVTGAIKGFLLG